jgi:hypothetical protein
VSDRRPIACEYHFWVILTVHELARTTDDKNETRALENGPFWSVRAALAWS